MFIHVHADVGGLGADAEALQLFSSGEGELEGRRPVTL